MVLMSILGVLLLVGVTLTLRWGGTAYRAWPPSVAGKDDAHLAPAAVTCTYLRGVAVAITGGFWAGALVTGPAVRLIMRLLAATAGAGAQGLLTEADEVIGNIGLRRDASASTSSAASFPACSAARCTSWSGAGSRPDGWGRRLRGPPPGDRRHPDRPATARATPISTWSGRAGWRSSPSAWPPSSTGMAVCRLRQPLQPAVPAPAGRRRPPGAAGARGSCPSSCPCSCSSPGVFVVFVLTVGLVVTLVASRIPPVGGRCGVRCGGVHRAGSGWRWSPSPSSRGRWSSSSTWPSGDPPAVVPAPPALTVRRDARPAFQVVEQGLQGDLDGVDPGSGSTSRRSHSRRRRAHQTSAVRSRSGSTRAARTTAPPSSSTPTVPPVATPRPST